MEVKILKLRMANFKGIKALEIDMEGKDVAVYGQNATGKTTLFDAFTWCLFGKDSTDKTDFWVKPHDENGEEIHFLETVVELWLLIDGKLQSFRHMVAENWVKKNGEADRVYSGNTHSYWVNDVSKSAGEYTKVVSQIVSPEVFRLITNPMAFNAVKWEKRREFLLKLSPVDVDQIMLGKTEYQPIRDAMEQHGTDIYGVRKVKQDARKRDNAEMDQIPVRISEQTATRDALGDCNVEAARAEITSIDSQIEQIEAAMSSGTEIIEQIKAKAAAVAQAESALRNAKMAEYRARTDAHGKASTELATVKARLKSAKITLDDIEVRTLRDQEELDRLNEQLVSTREEWYRVDDEKAPEYEGSTTCPTCGQELPADQIEQAKARFLQRFEEDKTRRLDSISKQGRSISDQIKRLEERMSRDKVDAEKLRATVAEDKPKITGLEAEVAALSGEPDYSQSKAIQQLEEKLAAAKAEYEQAASGQAPADDTLVQRKRDLIARKNDLMKVEAKRQQLDICNTRIAELEKRQQALGVQIADTEQFLMLVDKFVAERCSLLEESINSLFPSVRWSLFERQINGGMKDTCICLIGGVQFSDANNAARINAGLEIIGVLSKHYGVTVPVFIDNAEAVNSLQKMEAQRIALVVTKNDEVLRVESGIQNEEVA